MVLAAIPVKYCKTSMGQHHALEFVIDGVSHGGNHVSHPHGDAVSAAHFDDRSVTALVENEACNDTALMQIAPTPNTALQFSVVPALARSTFLELPVAEPTPGFAAQVFDAGRMRADPRMAAHRLMVLRI